MYGMIFSELRKYAEARLGAKGWDSLLEKAGLKKHTYMTVGSYPDSDAVALVGAASAITGLAVPAILEDFGAFIAPSLITMYGHLMKPNWKTLDVIENTEGTVHVVVRQQREGAQPPRLKATRVSAREVLLVYDSKRQMCALAKGIGKGLAQHFKEKITVLETQCMHAGAPRCEIHFRSEA